MNTQKFVAPTLKEALFKVKEALGENAVILKSEKSHSSGIGFGRREMIEVTAAHSDQIKSKLQRDAAFDDNLKSSMESESGSSRHSAPRYDIALLSEEVQRLRDEMGSIGKHFKYSNLPTMPVELTRTWESLQYSGMDREWATDLAQEALIQLNADDLSSAQKISDYMLKRLSSSVIPAVNQPLRKNRPFKIAVVGSPGAGKTTTLQKLLADPIGYAKRKTGIISFDTHRLAAVEQMKTFARVAGAPLEIIYSVDQLQNALARLSGCELILIDTPGCSSSDVERMNQLRLLLDAADPDETHLVLNSCTRDEEMIHACSRFRDLNVSHLTFTRLDESLKHGYLLNVARVASKPVAWLCSGQNFNGCLKRFSFNELSNWTNISVKNSMPLAAQLQ